MSHRVSGRKIIKLYKELTENWLRFAIPMAFSGVLGANAESDVASREIRGTQQSRGPDL